MKEDMSAGVSTCKPPTSQQEQHKPGEGKREGEGRDSLAMVGL